MCRTMAVVGGGGGGGGGIFSIVIDCLSRKVLCL